MLKKILAVLAVALTTLVVLPPDPADARRGFRVGGGFRGPAVRTRVIGIRPVHVRRPVRVYRPVRVIRRAPIVVVGGGGCEWLRQRALVRGSPYWWRRYRVCRGW